jgi:hypothetical protein
MIDFARFEDLFLKRNLAVVWESDRSLATNTSAVMADSWCVTIACFCNCGLLIRSLAIALGDRRWTADTDRVDVALK